MRGRIIGGLLLAAAMVACGGGGDGGDGGGDEPIDQADVLASAAVCDGKANAAAPAIGTGSDQLAFYVHDDAGWALDSFSADLTEDAVALNPDEAAITVCLSVIDTGASVSCPFEDEGDQFTLVVTQATYDVAIRASATGEVLDQGSATSKEAECPFSAFWTTGEGTRTDYVQPTKDVLAMLEPYLA